MLSATREIPSMFDMMQPCNSMSTPGSDLTSVSRSGLVSPASIVTVQGPARPPTAFQGTTGSRQAKPKGRPNSAARVGFPGSAHTQYRFDEPSPVYTARELGSPVPSRARSALISKAEAEAEAALPEWQHNFSKVFSLVHGWCQTYAKDVKPDDAVNVAARAPKLWEYMGDILYPGKPESGASHATFLLQESSSRPYFIERLILQYVFNSIFSVDGWMDFRDDVDQHLKSLADRLHNTEGKSYIHAHLLSYLYTIEY
jgi:hypothetical protein